ncbi:MAG: sulfatase, partial [Planctomycetota bacterium]
MTDRPNILYVFTDQQRATAMSCAGNPHLRTPHADRLAAEGVRFTCAGCAQPVCMPSRMAMQTGRWPHANGVIINHGQGPDLTLAWGALSGARPLLAQRLAQADYDCSYVGRWHITLPTERQDWHGYRRVVQCDQDDRAIAPAFAEQLDSRDPDRPFFTCIGICDPHDICHWPHRPIPNGSIADPPPPEDCPPLPDNVDIPAGEPALLRRFQRHRGYRQQGFTPDEWRQYRWAYARFVERADSILGEVLAALDRRDLRDNTVIVFSSDHGEGDASHRWCQKQALYDESVRVPFIVAPPACRRAGETDDRPIHAGIDLYPTLCDYAGIAPPPGLPGRS